MKKFDIKEGGQLVIDNGDKKLVFWLPPRGRVAECSTSCVTKSLIETTLELTFIGKAQAFAVPRDAVDYEVTKLLMLFDDFILPIDGSVIGSGLLECKMHTSVETVIVQGSDGIAEEKEIVMKSTLRLKAFGMLMQYSDFLRGAMIE